MWTDDCLMNAAVVRKVAEDARNQLLRVDPALKINTDRLVPALPRPTIGPHTQIMGAENIAVSTCNFYYFLFFFFQHFREI